MEEAGHSKELSDYSKTNTISINTKSCNFMSRYRAHDVIHYTSKDIDNSLPVVPLEAHRASLLGHLSTPCTQLPSAEKKKCGSDFYNIIECPSTLGFSFKGP